MQSMTDRKREFEAACAAAVKVRNFPEAAKAAAGAADCAEILANRTTGLVRDAYEKEIGSWRELARKLASRKNGAGAPPKASAPANGDVAASADGDEWLVAEKPDVTFGDIAGMEEAKRIVDEMVIYPMKSPEKARALEMIWCSPGTGVARGFWLGKYEVTQEQWRQVMGRNPSKYKGVGPERMPVDSVSLVDCQSFAARLNESTGVRGFRLPTATEWEYACRAGGSGLEVGVGQLNSRESRRKGPSPVGTYPPNDWGFCDMLGNVGEWTPDEYRHLVLRNGRKVCGGWWHLRASECLPTSRYRANQADRNKFFGLRIAFGPN